jgi:hypothetical protein
MPFLAEFPDQVVTSHAIVVAGLLAGEPVSPDTMLELAAEALTIDKLTTLVARRTRTIAETHDCWNATLACFKSCLDLWVRAPSGDEEDHLLAAHHHLLERLVANASERVDFYTVTPADREAFNTTRDHGFPLTSSYADS